jgi:hypothetical protein
MTNVIQLSEEVWEDIKGYEGLYRISSFGRIYSCDKEVGCKGGHKTIKKGRVLSPTKNNTYFTLTLVNGKGKRKQMSIHRIVATTFIPNPQNKPQVNHKNGDKHDNRLCNLEWCTYKENIEHAFRTGLRVIHNKGKNNGHRSKKVKQIDSNGNVVKIWPSTREAERFGYDSSIISGVCHGRYSHHKGYTWQYL